MKFKRNFWQGYKGYPGTKLDQTECELYDDIPSEDQKELMLKLLAGGQVAEARKRAIYYDAEDIDCEDENEGNDKESFDYVQAYNQYKQRKIELYKRKQEIEKQNLKNEMNELKKEKQEIDKMKKAENPPKEDK